MMRKSLCHKRNAQMTLRSSFRNRDAFGENFRLCATHTADGCGWSARLVEYLT
jgi:hypothetical protein